MDTTKAFLIFLFVALPFMTFFLASFMRGLREIDNYVREYSREWDKFFRNIFVVLVMFSAVSVLLPVTVVIGGIDIVKSWSNSRENRR